MDPQPSPAPRSSVRVQARAAATRPGEAPQILGCDPHPAARRGCGSWGPGAARGLGPRSSPSLRPAAGLSAAPLRRWPANAACREPAPRTGGAGDPALGAQTDAVRASTPQTPLLPRGDYKRFLGKLRTEGSGHTRRPACTCCGVGAQGGSWPQITEAQRQSRDQNPEVPLGPAPGCCLRAGSGQRAAGSGQGPAGAGPRDGGVVKRRGSWWAGLGGRGLHINPGGGRGEPERCSRDRAPKDLSRAEREPLRARVPAELSGRCPPPRSSRPHETGRGAQQDVPGRLGAEHPGQELLPHGGPGLVQGGQDGHRVALPHRPLRGRLHAHHRGLSPQVLLHPRRAVPAGHPRHVRQPPVPGHAAPLHPHRRRVHPGVQPGQPRLLRGGAEAQAADPGHQVVPQEQDQGERGRAAGGVREQGRPGLLPRGGAARDPAAGGRRPPALRLLRDLGQEEQQPGRDVPRALRHGQAAERDEPGLAPQGVCAVLRRAAQQEGAACQVAAARGQGRRRPRRRLRHRGALRAQAERAQRPPVHPREGRRRRPSQGQGALCHQLGAPRLGEGRAFLFVVVLKESPVRA